MLEIQVASDDWGSSQLADIHRLLENTASHFNRHLRPNEPCGRLLIRRRFEGVPQIIYRGAVTDPHTIYLTAHDRLWAKFAYQFAHEYFHFLSLYERLRENRHKWFEEILGEAASIFATRQMARTWAAFPPYPAWSSYSTCLGEYSKELCTRPSRRLPPGSTLPEWFAANENKLLVDPYQRDLNGTFAVGIIGIFDRDPNLWGTVRYLPSTDGSFVDFLRLWASAVPVDLRQGVGRIAQAFGIHHLEGCRT
jgi:hypothetical protein